MKFRKIKKSSLYFRFICFLFFFFVFSISFLKFDTVDLLLCVHTAVLCNGLGLARSRI